MEKLAAETGAYDIIALLGGLWTYMRMCPARHFDRDPETNEVLWFAAPPLNVARRPAPRYSLQYLHWLATKRKKVEEDEDSMDVDDSEGCPKRVCTSVQLTATETVEKLLMDVNK
jgi:chromatin structure-remodeling complex subunit RSC1/2